MAKQLITLKDFADNYNSVLNRRGQQMSEGYLYRLIRQDIKGEATRSLWFKYILTGKKDRIFIELK
jgi:hypothetical protein